MNTITAASLYDTLDPATREDLACPPWCCLPPGHDLGDDQARRAGGIYREHRSRDLVVTAESAFGRSPVVVRALQFVAAETSGAVDLGPVSIDVDGIPDIAGGLTLPETATLLTKITEAIHLVGTNPTAPAAIDRVER